MTMNKKMRRGGFTIIELLLVMVILAVLAAVVVPKFVGRSEQAKLTAADSDITSIETMLDAYEIDMGGYPQTDDGIEMLVDKPSGDEGDNWHGPYLDEFPIDPWGNEYVYEYPGRENEYGFDLSSAGPDGQDGNDDDIHNWEDESARQRR